MENKGSKYYYSRLSDGEKQLYDKLCGALLRFEPALSFHSAKPFEVDIERVFLAVMLDNPIFFYVNRERVKVAVAPTYIRLSFDYDYGRREAEELWARIEEKVEDFAMAKLRAGMSPLKKQLEIHRYVTSIGGATAPYGKDCFSAVGALLRNCAVCEGYSKAYKLLCDRAGIASIIAIGDAILPDGGRERHAWNITRIDGVTAHTDATWDARYGVSNYDYFNLSDEEIRKDHEFESGKYPECRENTINYFAKNGLIANDRAELCEMIEKMRGADKFSVKLKFEIDEKDIPNPRAALVNVNKTQNIINYFGGRA